MTNRKMLIHVTPSEFSRITELKRRIDDIGMTSTREESELVDILVKASVRGGDYYDADLHRRGQSVELVVVV